MHDANYLVRPSRLRRQGCLVLLATLILAGSAAAQTVDCGRLQQQIAAGDRGGRNSQGLRRFASELARTQAYAHQLGCDGFTLFGGDPQCPGLNGRIQQLQASVAQQQAGGGGGRGDLVARFNAYCRGAPPPPEGGGFFDRLFGSLSPQPAAPPPPAVLDERRQEDDDDDRPLHGGSQAVCVRSCDGGFFPLPISARHNPDELTQMCQALCPGTEASVFTRAPNADIKSAVSLDGHAYMDQQNALAFQKSYTPACSCRPAGKSWAETLATAEELLDNTRKGDIVVTPEKSAELSRPTGVVPAPTPNASPAPSSKPPVTAGAAKPAIRQVGPQP